jgi:predicted nuclease of restriction endonuclease-like (RecB) superfamily
MDNKHAILTLSSVANDIHTAHKWFSEQAALQVNTYLTLRNWVIGLYIREYEQRGADRAQYGEKILLMLSKHLHQKGLKSMGDRRLREYRLFYETYPQIWRTASAKFQNIDNQHFASLFLLKEVIENSGQIEVVQHLDIPQTDPDILVNLLSFSHFLELVKCDTALQRLFYETESIVNNWNVRDLQRAMSSLLFERTGFSKDKYAVLNKHRKSSGFNIKDIIRNPYMLDFLELEDKPEFSESDLEQAIINHLQKFLMELGRGFCFEARQRRITFGNKHYRIDLVFYHRVLKCHVLIDLKIGDFDHSDAGQMNLYLNYFRENEMTEGDNPPVGVILCAQKDDALVHYATGNLSHSIFVSKYLVNFPTEEELKKIVREEQERIEK